MIKVGGIKCWEIHGKKREKPLRYNYSDVEFDEEGWASAAKFLPEDFDLVYLKIEGKKITGGWINGKKWDGARIYPGDKVISWKRKPEEKN